jgi:hypothetical protein
MLGLLIACASHINKQASDSSLPTLSAKRCGPFTSSVSSPIVDIGNRIIRGIHPGAPIRGCSPFMTTHIDQLACLFKRSESSFHYWLRTDQQKLRQLTVSSLPRIHIQQAAHLFHCFYLYLSIVLNDSHVPPRRFEIGTTFYDFCLHLHGAKILIEEIYMNEEDIYVPS